MPAGHLRGASDIVVSRGVDVLLGVSCLLFAIGRMAVMGPGLGNVIIALLVREWVSSCHVVSAETRAAREMDHVEAARALGAGRRHIMMREIMPNIVSPVSVVATFRLATIIIIEAPLSFLGLGVQPPVPSRGSMVADCRASLLDACHPARCLRSVAAAMSEPLLAMHGLVTCSHTRQGVVRAVDLEVLPGECLGVAGESDSGKSVTFMSVIGLVGPPGRIETARPRLGRWPTRSTVPEGRSSTAVPRPPRP